MLKHLFTLILALLCPCLSAADTPRVAVASNMFHAMSEVAQLFKSDTGHKIRLTMGSSGNFTHQIVQGAPFDIFLSADRKYLAQLKSAGVPLVDEKHFARGRISLFIPSDSSLSEASTLDNALKDLFHGKYTRLVIANPEHAPYGLAARQALQTAGLWVIEKKRFLIAENAAQAGQLSLSGSVDAGIIPASFEHLSQFKGQGRFFPIPDSWHEPLQQYLILLNGTSESAVSLFNYLDTDKSRNVIRRYGYSF